MIKILILTKDINSWLRKISANVKIVQIKKENSVYIINSEFFYFVIKSSFSENSRGESYSCAILDMEIDNRLKCEIIEPTVKCPIIKTENYYKK